MCPVWLHVNVVKSNFEFFAEAGLLGLNSWLLAELRGSTCYPSGFQGPEFLSLEPRAQRVAKENITMINGWESSICLER